jgi:hypothetical protein
VPPATVDLMIYLGPGVGIALIGAAYWYWKNRK